MSEAVDDRPVSLAMDLVAQLAIKLKAHPMHKHPGCWEHQVDENWRIAVNGHRDPRNTSDGLTVPPFECYVEFNGWPAGFINPFGGVLAAGAAANEDTFIQAVRDAIEALPQ
jgi:hypothetical protein